MLGVWQVVARIRPANGIESGTQAVRKASDTSVCVADRKFNFDMVFGSNSNQVGKFNSQVSAFSSFFELIVLLDGA